MPGSSPPRLAVAVADAELREMVQRLAAIAGVTASPVGAAESSWRHSEAVVVDAGVARTSAGSAGRRHRLLVVTDSEPAVDVWQAAVHLGAEAVAVLPRDERMVTTWMAGTAEPPSRGRLIGCVGIRGGSGASTLAAAIALAAGRHGSALLVDFDPSAGGIDLLLGLENVPGARWDGLADAAGMISAAALAGAVPSVGALRVLSCAPGQPAPAAEAAQAVVSAGLRGHDLVVADLGAAPEPAESATESVRAGADLLVVVVPADVRAVTAAAAVVPVLTSRCRELKLVVRHPGPGDLRPRDVAQVVGVEVADVWPWDRRLGRIVDTGSFARRWRHTSVAAPARRLVAALAQAPG